MRGEVAIAMRPDGSRKAFTPYPTPLFGDDGELIGAVNMLIDVSHDQARALSEQAGDAAGWPPRSRPVYPSCCAESPTAMSGTPRAAIGESHLAPFDIGQTAKDHLALHNRRQAGPTHDRRPLRTPVA